jgi:selenocysteine lyase/cysteine desulfurase
LHVLKRERGIVVDEVRTDDALCWDLDDLDAKLREGANLVVISHASNVTGAVQELDPILSRVHGAGARLLLDAAQTVGAVPIDVDGQGIDLLAFSGHKALLGPTGTGGLYVRPGLAIRPLLTGGTGSASEDEEPPTELPGGLETGTANAVGFAALAVAVDWIRESGVAATRAHGVELRQALVLGAQGVPGLTPFSGGRPTDLATLSFVVDGWDPQELAMVLDGLGVAVRAGLHCAPRSHRRLGTSPAGTVRASCGPFLSAEDVAEFWERVRAVCSP